MIGTRAIAATAALGGIGLGIVVFRAGAAVPPSFLDSGFGSGLLPQCVGGALVVLSALWLLESVRGASVPVTFAAREVFRPVVLTALFAALLVNLELHLLPFYPTAAAFVFLSAVLLGARSRRGLLLAGLAALGSTLLVWVVFTQIFLVILE